MEIEKENINSNGGKVLLKVHKSYRIVIAVCDKELYGEKIIDGKKQLDLTGEFFKGEEMTLEEAKERIINYYKEDATFNFIGEKSVALALETGIIEKEGILKVSGVPFSLRLL
tara:strand:- start:861 stop:1199 length:339 start_codon:yes stop_codon:yes gene_type:complete